MTTRSPDHPITGSPDLLQTNPITATCPGDSTPDLQQLVQTLNEARRQFLASRRLFLDSKRRYLMLKQLVFVRREIERRRLLGLDEQERASLHRQDDNDTAGRSQDPNHAQDDAAGYHRLEHELHDNVLYLEKLRRLIHCCQLRLYYQECELRGRRQAAAAQCLPRPAMHHTAVRLEKLKELLRRRYELRLRQERDLRNYRPSADASRPSAGQNSYGHTLGKSEEGLQSTPVSVEPSMESHAGKPVPQRQVDQCEGQAREPELNVELARQQRVATDPCCRRAGTHEQRPIERGPPAR